MKLRFALLLATGAYANTSNSCRDSAGKVPILLNGQSKNKYCSWFLKKNRRDRYCEDPTVTEHCPLTCGTCAVPPQSDKCTIVAQTVLSLDEGSDDTFFECILDPIDAGGEENVIVPIQISDAQKEDLLTKFNTGELLSGESALALDDVGTKISGRGGILVQSNKEHVSIKKTLIRGSSRRLASTKGDKPILVIRVTDSEGRVRPESADQISDDIFGTFGDSNTLKSQMSDCSFGQLNVTAGVGDDKETSPGVIDITIDIPLVGASRSTVRRAVTNEAASFLGHSLPGPYQQVMIVLEKCYTDCGWAAYAYANSWLSVYQDSYYKMVGVQMHEIGHNLNLAHSGGLDGKTYTDHTGLMGNPLYKDDDSKMCFNAAKNWQIGWYDSNKLSIDPTLGPWTGTIVGIADFENNPHNHPVVVKIETGTVNDQFIAFNRARGVNQNNDQADNEVTIIQSGANGESYSQSYLKATLKSGDLYTIPNWDGVNDLAITASAIDINPTNGQPGFAEVSVCLGQCSSSSPSAQPSLRPSAAPSRNPTVQPSMSPSRTPTVQPSSTPSHIPSANDNDVPIHYSQMGPAFDGKENANNALGSSVALSKSGSRMAVASPGLEAGSGFVQVYDWFALDQQWVQVGDDIVGGAPSYCRGLGHSMDVNEDGSRIILGAPESKSDDGIVRIYEFESSSSSWVLLGNEIIPVAGTKGHAGFSVTINNAGDRIAYGSPRTNGYRGSVTAMALEGGIWVAMGQTLEGLGYYASAGTSVAMDAEGTRLVVGATHGNWFRGNVDVLDYDEASSQWISVGSLGGDAYYDRFGSDVDISEDGVRIIVGAVANDEGGLKNVGSFMVFEYGGGSIWNQLGQEVTGVAKHDKLGEAVAISGDGSFVAVSSPKNEDNGILNSGKVEVYTYSEEDQVWVPQAPSIQGADADNRIGEGNGSIAMDRSGNHIAIGAQRGNYYDGVAYAYEASF